MPANTKRVFYVEYLSHTLFADILAQRPDVRLDKLRALPAEKAAAAGYTFKPNYVYDVRNAEKKRKAKAARSTSAPKPTAHATTSGANEVAVPTRAAPSANQSDLGAQFRRIMVELGLAQAEVHYNEVRRQLKAISGS